MKTCRRAQRLLQVTGLLLLAARPGRAEKHRGRDFLACIPPNDGGNSIYVLCVEMQLLAELPTTARVECPARAPTFVSLVDVLPDAPTVVEFPLVASLAWEADRVTDNCVRVTADHDVALQLASLRQRSSDAALALPVQAMGREHFLFGFDLAGPLASTFIVVASEDDTRVRVTPTADLVGRPSGADLEADGWPWPPPSESSIVSRSPSWFTEPWSHRTTGPFPREQGSLRWSSRAARPWKMARLPSTRPSIRTGRLMTRRASDHAGSRNVTTGS